MALTLEAEQKLESAGLITYFENNLATWQHAAQRAYSYTKRSFPAGVEVRRDDVALALGPVVRVSEELQNKLSQDKLKQRFWVDHFTDLIIDRTWGELVKGDNE